MRIHSEGLALPVTHKFTNAITVMLNEKGISGNSVTINFRDPTYSAESGGFHPVEIRLERQNNTWHLCYITDFVYVGSGPCAELAKTSTLISKQAYFKTFSAFFLSNRQPICIRYGRVIFCITGKF